MKETLRRWRRAFRFRPAPDPIDLLVRAFSLDPFGRSRASRARGDKKPDQG